MDNLHKLVRVLNDLKAISSSIITQATPILSEIGDKQTEIATYIADQLAEQKIAPSEDEIIEALQVMSLEVVSNAEIIKKEIDTFAMMVSVNVDLTSSTETRAPFLRSVFLGEIYEEDGKEGLFQLLEELQSVYDSVDYDNIVQSTVSYLKRKYEVLPKTHGALAI